LLAPRPRVGRVGYVYSANVLVQSSMCTCMCVYLLARLRGHGLIDWFQIFGRRV